MKVEIKNKKIKIKRRKGRGRWGTFLLPFKNQKWYKEKLIGPQIIYLIIYSL